MEQVKKQNKRFLQGVVVSDKMSNTATVQVERTIRHPHYNKFVKRFSKYHAHVEGVEFSMGDKVLIVESRPVSKSKRWRLEKVLEKASA